MQVYGLVGNPVGHSLSPPMHEAAYRALDVDARYVTFEPAPGDLAAAIEGARALGIDGLNVTIPFKESVLDLVDPDDRAARIGAVNTIDFRPDGRDPDGGDPGYGDPGGGMSDGEHPDGRTPRPRGHNTDAAGALSALREAGADPDGASAVVVGAGGAGRAIAFGLADAGADVQVANRTVERARGLAEEVGGAAHGLDALPDLVPDADVLVNATSVGMEEDASPVPAAALHGDLVAFDAVYRPLDTKLLREAADRGATTVDGGRMLLYQGAAAFEIWTGRDAPVEAMETALYDRL